MSEFNIIDITPLEWTKIEGFSSKGRREKCWYENNISHEVYLHKFPKVFRNSTNFITQEIWTELIAFKVGTFIGLNIPEAIPAMSGDGFGILIKNFLKRGSMGMPVSELIEAKELLSHTSMDRPHNLDLIRNLVVIPQIDNDFWDEYRKMLIFDCLIGNNDRHDENWGFLINIGNEKFSLAPIYDNASCLAYNLDEQKIIELLNDKEKFKSFLIGSKSRPPNLYIDRNIEKKFNHYQIMMHLITLDVDMKDIINDLLKLDYINYIKEVIEKIQQLNVQNEYILSDNRKDLILSILYERRRILQELLNVHF